MNNRVKKETSEKKKKRNIFSSSISAMLNGEFLTRESVTKHLPFIFFLTFLFLLNISWVYFSENTVRDITKTKRQLHEMQSEYNSVTSELEERRRQSEVATNISELGLNESIEPAMTIAVEPGFFDEKQ